MTTRRLRELGFCLIPLLIGCANPAAKDKPPTSVTCSDVCKHGAAICSLPSSSACENECEKTLGAEQKSCILAALDCNALTHCKAGNPHGDNNDNNHPIDGNQNNPSDNDPSCNNCGPNATCVKGSCVCNDGFVASGITCVPLHPKQCTGCDVNAFCANGTCQCKDGYSGDGTSCTLNAPSCAPQPVIGSCQTPATCWVYTGSSFGGGEGKAECDQLQGAWLAGLNTCAAGLYTSGCVHDCGSSSEFILYLASPVNSEQAARDACKGPPAGVWLGSQTQ
jgi:hypothetical protein